MNTKDISVDVVSSKAQPTVARDQEVKRGRRHATVGVAGAIGSLITLNLLLPLTVPGNRLLLVAGCVLICVLGYLSFLGWRRMRRAAPK